MCLCSHGCGMSGVKTLCIYPSKPHSFTPLLFSWYSTIPRGVTGGVQGGGFLGAPDLLPYQGAPNQTDQKIFRFDLTSSRSQKEIHINLTKKCVKCVLMNKSCKNINWYERNIQQFCSLCFLARLSGNWHNRPTHLICLWGVTEEFPSFSLQFLLLTPFLCKVMSYHHFGW